MNKTIVISHNYTKSSFAFMSYSLANSLANEGNKVIFMSHKPFFEKPFNEKVCNGQLIIYSWSKENKRPTGIKDFILFAKIFVKHKPDICIGHFVGANITSIVSKILSLGKTRVYNYYHTLSTQLNIDSTSSLLKKKFLKFRKKIQSNLFVDYFICPSILAKDDLFQQFGISKSIVVLNPLEDRFILNENEVQSHDIIISFLGRIDISKGVFELVDAFIEYIKRNSDSKIILQIAGNGSKVTELKKRIEGVEKIKYYGGIEYSQIDLYIKSSNFMIIPSIFDNLPTVCIESLMNGIPVLISNSTGISSFINNNVNGFKFNVNKTELEKIFETIESNTRNHSKLKEQARNTYLELFTIEQYINTMKGILFETNQI